MNAGKLVPDDLTLRVVEDRLTQPDTANGALFDGFPRTIPQAEGLDRLLEKKGTKVAIVLFLKLSRDEAVTRISARWQNPNDPNDIYNLLTNPPKVAGRSDKDGAVLIQRPDDTPEAAAKRIDLFFQETAPLFEFYRKRGILVEIDANQPIEAVTADIKAAIGKVAG
jgi:adenylate kinase